jgi:murein L,D-transpeptidase YafK
MKCIVTVIVLVFLITTSFAQPSFVDYQKTYPRVATAVRLKEDTLKKQFGKAGLQWPANQVYIRSFKYDSQLEVWVRNSSSEAFKLFKTYKICALQVKDLKKLLVTSFRMPEIGRLIN